MEELIKNLPQAQPFALKEQVQYEDGKVVSLTLAQKPGVGMTLFAFAAGEAISTHAAPGDAMAHLFAVTAQFAIAGTPIVEGPAEHPFYGVPPPLGGGEAVMLPAGIPHAVKAVTRFKMYLVVVKA